MRKFTKINQSELQYSCDKSTYVNFHPPPYAHETALRKYDEFEVASLSQLSEAITEHVREEAQRNSVNSLGVFSRLSTGSEELLGNPSLSAATTSKSLDTPAASSARLEMRSYVISITQTHPSHPVVG